MENKTAEVIDEQIASLMVKAANKTITYKEVAQLGMLIKIYAQQQSIGFAEWLGNNKWDWSIVNSDYSRLVGKDIEIKQSSDLYQIYSQQKWK